MLCLSCLFRRVSCGAGKYMTGFRTTARPGDEVEFAMDVARLHVFDKETEMVITH